MSHDPETNVDLIAGLVIVDAFLSFIIIPSVYLFFSYIWNNEITKTVIVAEGWCRSFQFCKRPKKVVPDDKEGVEERTVYSSQPLPIQTISESISSLEKQQMDVVRKELEGNYKMLLANNIFYNP